METYEVSSVFKFKISFIFLLMGFALQALCAEDSDDIERFTITGSHIKELDREGTTPVITIDREQLDFSGAGSLGDVIRTLSFASLGVTRKQSMSEGNGGAFTSFRGLPRNYLLILINGKRIASNDQDINLIPLSAIEKVEIIKDGASAIYGSDAVGGVMNFITKRGDIGETFSIDFYLPEPFVLPKKVLPFQGWRSQAWAKVPKFQNEVFGLKGGEELKAEYTRGWTGDQHETLFGITARMQTNVKLDDRPFGVINMDSIKLFSPNGSPGSYQSDGPDNLIQAMPDCPQNLRDKNDQGDEVCRFNYTPFMEMSPTVVSGSSFLTSHTDLNADHALYSHVLYTVEYSKGVSAPPPQLLKRAAFIRVKKADDPQRVQLFDNWASQALKEASIPGTGLKTLQYRLVDEKGAGQRIENMFKHNLSLQSELETYMSDTWNANTSFSVGGYLGLGRSKNYAQITRLLELNEDGSTKWNPFKTEKDDITYATYEPEFYEHQLAGLLEMSAAGEVLGGKGVLRSAVGGRAGYEHWRKSMDKITWDTENLITDQWGGWTQQTGNGGRYFGSLFGEFILPLVFNEQNLLEFQLAGSVDYYQYAGFAQSKYNLKAFKLPLKELTLPFNPKVSAKWKIMDHINLRGSWGTAFKAPKISSLHMNRVVTHPSGVDWMQCKAGTKEECSREVKGEQYETVVFGNEDLKPETSHFWNIGITLEPLNQIMFSVDYFSNKIWGRPIDTIYHLGDILEAEKFLDAKTFEKFKKENSIMAINRTANGILEGVEFKIHNFNSYTVQGMDFVLSIQSPFMSYHTMFFDTHATYFSSIKEKRPYLDEKFINKLGTWGYPVYKVLFQWGLRYKNGLKWALSSHWVDGFNDNTQDVVPEAFHQKKVTRLFKESFVKPCYSEASCKEKEESVADYNKDENNKQKKIFVRQVPDHITFDLNVSIPLSVLDESWSSQSSLLFRLENILNSMPPEHRGAGNHVTNASGLSSIGTGFMPNGIYSGINGRAWQLRYTHKF